MLSRIARKLGEASQNLRVLGFFGTIKANAANISGKYSHSASGKLVELATRTSKTPIYYRLGTSDWQVAQKIFMDGEYDIPSPSHATAAMRFYQRMLAEARRPVIIDCGANIGLASVAFANRFPGAIIYAIEPEPENFAVLQKNVGAYDNIVPLKAAVSDRETMVSLSNGTGEAWAWETTESPDGDVATVTINGLLACQADAALFIVKIDIEGFEVELFRSNIDWVGNAPIVVYESHDWMFPWRGTAQAMLSVLNMHPRDYLQRGETMFAISHSLG